MNAIKQSGSNIGILKDASLDRLDAPLEQALIKEAQSGNRAAEERLIRANIRFVITIAKNYRNRDTEFSDLVAEGILGLRHAIMLFDRDDIKLISYAVWWIRQRIINFLTKDNVLVRQTGSLRLAHKRKVKLADTLVKQYNSKNPRLHDEDFLLSDELPEALMEKQELLGDVSLDAKLGIDGSGDSRIETMAADDNDILDQYFGDDEVDLVHCVIREALKYRALTYKLFCHSYGVFGHEYMTLKDLADSNNLTRERVRQLQTLAMNKVQQALFLRGLTTSILSPRDVNKLFRRTRTTKAGA
jgi:RNA polymerase primary sigma factor